MPLGAVVEAGWLGVVVASSARAVASVIAVDTTASGEADGESDESSGERRHPASRAVGTAAPCAPRRPSG